MKATDRRRSTRLPSHSYVEPGPFFVTICSYRRAMLFGDVIDDIVSLSPIGRIISECWADIPAHFPRAEPMELVVMPNHVHGVIMLHLQGLPEPVVPPPTSLQPLGIQVVIRNFKAAATVASHRLGHNGPVWQRGYYDRILRNEDEFRRACDYIALNPMRWALDAENPDREAH